MSSTAGALARPPAGGDELNTYLDGLFADLLNRCIDEAQAGPSSDAYSRMAMPSLVLARLAGFLARHVALNEDPMRKLMEATALGYGEADMSVRGHAHAHGREHY